MIQIMCDIYIEHYIHIYIYDHPTNDRNTDVENEFVFLNQSASLHPLPSAGKLRHSLKVQNPSRGMSISGRPSDQRHPKW